MFATRKVYLQPSPVLVQMLETASKTRKKDRRPLVDVDETADALEALLRGLVRNYVDEEDQVELTGD